MRAASALAVASLVLIAAVCSEAASQRPQIADLAQHDGYVVVEAGKTLGGQIYEPASYVLYAGDMPFDELVDRLRNRFKAAGWTERPVVNRDRGLVVRFSDASNSTCVSFSSMGGPDPFIPLPLALVTVEEARLSHTSVILRRASSTLIGNGGAFYDYMISQDVPYGTNYTVNCPPGKGNHCVSTGDASDAWTLMFRARERSLYPWP